MYFSTDGMRKTYLDKCLKSSLSEEPLTSNSKWPETLPESERQNLYNIY